MTHYDSSQVFRFALAAGIVGGLVGYAISSLRKLATPRIPYSSGPIVLKVPSDKFFEGKVAIVTGSTSGIGEAIVRQLHDSGACVVINSSKSIEAGKNLEKELGRNALYVQGDMYNEEDTKKLVSETLNKFGKIDFLINNAGTTKKIPHSNFEAVTTELWDKILTVNLVGPFNLSKAAIPHLKKTKGHIINISSAAGLRPIGSSIPYSCSKAALVHLTQLLAKALDDVQVNVVCPGLIKTPWITAGDENYKAKIEDTEKNTTYHRLGESDEIAQGVLGLLRNKYVSGAVLTIDGGLILRV